MKVLWTLPIFILFQCTNEIDEQEPVKIIYLTDTVYIEKEFIPKKKLCQLTCIETVWTNLDLNLCSLECLEKADSILEEKFLDILKSYEVEILKTKELEYVEIYPGYNESLKKQKRDFAKLNSKFKELKSTLEKLIHNSLWDARLAPYYCNTYLLEMVENQIELYDNLQSEILNLY